MNKKILTRDEAEELYFKYRFELTAEALDGYVKFNKRCFAYCRDLQKIEIPEGVEEIGEQCFEGCTHLSEISLPSTLKTINVLAFIGCFSLEKIKIPEGVTLITSYAFANCWSLKYVEVGKNLSIVDRYAFIDNGLKNVFLHNDEGKLITYKAMNTDMTCMDFQYKEGQTYEIPKEQKIEVGNNGFHSCNNPYSCLNYYYGEYGKNLVICKCIAEGDIDNGPYNNNLVSRKITILKKFDSYYDVFEDYNRELENLKTTKDNC